MNRIRIPLIFLLTINALQVFSQEVKDFDLQDNGPEKEINCALLRSTLNDLPVEENFSLHLKDNHIWLMVSEDRWFDKLFANDQTGLAVDIIRKSQFTCGQKNSWAPSSIYRGELLPPVYSPELRKKKAMDKDGIVWVDLGSLPESMAGDDVELNLLLLQGKFLCQYIQYYHLPLLQWELLKMGMYRDTLLASKPDDAKGQQIITYQKEFRFVIPFEKDKYEYKPADIQPLRDSLRLTDFIIKSIDIRAYSSVEGPTDHNIQLQNKRAETLAASLQSFQTPKISTTIHAAENWVEFFNDIEGTSFASLKDQSKSGIKQKLSDAAFNASMEGILKNHRKGIVTLQMFKKTIYTESAPEKLREDLRTAIREKNINAALALQSVLFQKIQNEEVPENFIASVEIPMESTYGGLLRNDAAFRFELHPENLDSAITEFESLEILLPKDEHVSYNLCVLQIKKWMLNEDAIDARSLKTRITRLAARGIDKTLQTRLLINYNMIESGYMMKANNYGGKDQAVGFVNSNQRFLKPSQSDLFNLAKFYAHHAKYDWAVRTLHEHVKDIDADDEPLFYYLNLTIIHPARTKHKIYRSIMLNAINNDRQRFCRLFDPNHQKGITFQLLGDEDLKRTYCENCASHQSE
ncbi:MAG: hypothetical protein KDD36_03680 [Flavobacteriales bacterium]|nr:hypothetical protein [Flavobacteriales bacterium]